MIKVYGHSDDCVEIEGDFKKEIYSFDKPLRIYFDDGTDFIIKYNNEGNWVFDVIKKGKKFKKILPIDIKDPNNYTECLIMYKGCKTYGFTWRLESPTLENNMKKI